MTHDTFRWCLIGMEIAIIKIRRSNDSLIFIMTMPYMEDGLCIKMGLCVFVLRSSLVPSTRGLSVTTWRSLAVLLTSLLGRTVVSEFLVLSHIECYHCEKTSLPATKIRRVADTATSLGHCLFNGYKPLPTNASHQKEQSLRLRKTLHCVHGVQSKSLYVQGSYYRGRLIGERGYILSIGNCLSIGLSLFLSIRLKFMHGWVIKSHCSLGV